MKIERYIGLGNSRNLNGYNTRPSEFRGAWLNKKKTTEKLQKWQERNGPGWEFPDLDNTTWQQENSSLQIVGSVFTSHCPASLENNNKKWWVTKELLQLRSRLTNMHLEAYSFTRFAVKFQCLAGRRMTMAFNPSNPLIQATNGPWLR